MSGLLIATLASHAWARQGPGDEGQAFTVFLNARPIGQETVSVIERPDGWLVRGSNRLGPPLDVVTRVAEIEYDTRWQPRRLLIEGTARGQEATIRSSFADGEAATEVVIAGQSSSKTDKVAADALVLPNAFLGSYAALARRLVGQQPGATFRAYIAPQGEIAMRLDGAFAERIETPKQTIAATRYTLMVPNTALGGEMQVSVWSDGNGGLLRLSVPAQGLEVAREDIASAAARTTSFSVPGDETVHIPASGFSLAASVTRPAGAKGPLPAVVLVGGSDAVDRDGAVGGVPVLGQIASDLVNAGFVVVRYDRRGIGQSGGRAETATIMDYAEDVRAVIAWLDRQRKEVDRRRIALVGHGDGAWIAMRAADRDNRVAALVLVAAVSSKGAEYTLEQQRDLLARLNATDEERQAKIALQERINAAALQDTGWDEVPETLRAAADTPWFQSFLRFDPARVIRDLREPILIVHGELDTEVASHHADRLAELARARRRKVETELAKVPGVNHLLVPATTGRVEEYATLPDKKVSPAATSAIAAWLTRVMD
ncbi:MAG TPA: alpha/beta fold hydrolase [Vicinamibacterales bacterium]|nr:alpha/beta fold hydrolase [Vicinamibacterales bacterium]